MDAGEDLKFTPCACGSKKEQIIDAERKVRIGWWCPICNAFEKAILRERVWRSTSY